jgi:hypothetical protein
MKGLIMKFVNLTPHNIVLNDGSVIEKEDSTPVARVASSHTEFNEYGICRVIYGEVEDLPAPEDGTIFIVSAMVLSRVPDRKDVVAPATGHPGCVRENGRIVSVPGFVGN